jgi:hypothetical protein
MRFFSGYAGMLAGACSAAALQASHDEQSGIGILSVVLALAIYAGASLAPERSDRELTLGFASGFFAANRWLNYMRGEATPINVGVEAAAPRPTM